MELKENIHDVFEDVFHDNQRFFREATIKAALELGLFSVLQNHPMTCEELAKHLDVSRHRLHALLRVLVFEGFMNINHANQTFAVKETPDYIPSLPDQGWGLLDEVVRNDKPLELNGDDPLLNSRCQNYLFDTGYPSAQWLWQLTGTEGGSLLDIGSGFGAYSAAFLERNSDNFATLVDRKEVLDPARDLLNRYGGRVRFCAADAFDLFTEKSDIVLLSNILHLYGQEECRGLAASAARNIKQGGLMIIKDLWIDDDFSRPDVSLYFSLNMALYTESGEVHSASNIIKGLTEAGLADIRKIISGNSVVVMGTKT
ncbi:MAG: methyltransferase domain-containing protein [Nitrospirae bacterium]|nr:methyltransferase domain-containing protein [Nitrospirota bacterium]